MTFSRKSSVAVALLLVLVLSGLPARAQDFDDSIRGPRQQLSLAMPFSGDAAFKQPTRAISETYGEPRQLVTGSGWVTSVSGYVLLPRGQHVLKVQIVNGTTDPIRSEVLATLDYDLSAVAPEGNYYALSLPGPVRIADLNNFSVLVLRDAASSDRAEVTAMLGIVQSSR
jgi:hypothetical protein